MAMIREGAAELGLVPMKTITPDDGHPAPAMTTPRLASPVR